MSNSTAKPTPPARPACPRCGGRDRFADGECENCFADLAVRLHWKGVRSAVAPNGGRADDRIVPRPRT